MEDLIKKRAEQGVMERLELKVWSQFREKQRERFEYAETQHHIREDKNRDDTGFILEALLKWHGLSKDDEKKKHLYELSLAILRVINYCENIETTCKHSVTMYISELAISKNTASSAYTQKLKYESTITTMQKTIDALKKEIEFISK